MALKVPLSEYRLCLLASQSQQVETIKLSSGSFPVEIVGVDLFQTAGQHFLCMVDRCVAGHMDILSRGVSE